MRTKMARRAAVDTFKKWPKRPVNQNQTARKTSPEDKTDFSQTLIFVRTRNFR